MKKGILTTIAGLLIFTASTTFQAATNEINPISEINIEGNDKVELKITGMTCSGCASLVTETLDEMEGVKKVSLEYPGNVAIVEFDAKSISQNDIIKAIEGLEFHAEVVKK